MPRGCCTGMTTAATDSELASDIAAGADALGQPLTTTQRDQLVLLLRTLEKWSRAYNLTAIRDVSAMVPLHILDSLSVHDKLYGRDIMDVGTGAGFPGLPLAIVQRNRRFLLLDSSAKKLQFVEHAAGMLGLDNVRVAHARVEDYASERGFDTVICRAFASLAVVVRDCAHHVRDGGRIVAMKGRDPGDEIAEIAAGWTTVAEPVTVPTLNQQRHLIILRREENGSSDDRD